MRSTSLTSQAPPWARSHSTERTPIGRLDGFIIVETYE